MIDIIIDNKSFYVYLLLKTIIMKNALFIFFILLTNFFVRSQVSSYTFTETTGTYTTIVGGTQLVTTTGGVTAYDTDGSYFTLPVGSQFIFNNVTITSVNMTADGAIWLNPGTTTTGNGTTGAISSTATATGVICGMNMDLRSTAIASQVYERRWQDDGTEVIFQWQNCARYSTTTPFVQTERFSFQIRINKTTGVVRVVYGNMTTIAASTQYVPMVGLRGTTNTDYNNRRLTGTVPDATPNWGAPNGTTAGTSNAHTVRFTSTGTCFPTSGLIFVWTPPACSSPTSPLISYTSPTSANLSWTASPSLPTNGYEWEMRTSGLGGSGATGLVASGSVGAGVTTASTSSLTQNTTYTLYVRSNCGGTFSSWVASASSTSPIPAPSNDNCSSATVLSCGTSGLAGTTVGSVLETAPLGYSSPYGVWYSFVGDGQSTTITSVAGTGFDHEMVIMSGTICGATYTLITDQDVGFAAGTETYTFTTVNGTQYYIYIAYYSTTGLSTNTGTFTMSRTCTAPPTPPINDNPSGAIGLTLNLGTYSTYTNVNATSTSEATPSCASYAGEDVWFSVLVPSNGIVELDMIEGVITDGGMSVYTGSIGSLSQIACDDDNSVNGLMPYLYLTGLSAGQTLYIRVWEYGGGTTGTFGILANSPIGLPVELLYFNGKTYPSFNLLTWSTASEHNSDYFNIERSINGENWDIVGVESAMGNSNTKTDYSFSDLFDNNEIHYYRLVQYDYDGQYKIYGPIGLDNRKPTKTIIKYVNLMGQEVSSDTKGFIFEVYDDGTMRKIIR